MSQTFNKTDYKKLLRTTDKYITILIDNGFMTPYDLLRHLPRTYEDRRVIKPARLLLGDGSTEITKAKVIKKSMIRTPTGKLLIEITCIDEEEQKVSINILNNRFFLKKVQTDRRYYIIGKPNIEGSKIQFWYPEVIEAIDTAELQGQIGCIYPIYSDLQGIKGSRFGKKIPTLLSELLKEIADPYPQSFYDQYELLAVKPMLHSLHAPESIEETIQAKKTLFFKRMLNVQLQSQLSKRQYQQNTKETTKKIDRECIKEFLTTLPFTLTTAQKKSLKEIIENINQEKPMLRLLQGDVGSGKTVVAAAAAWYTIKKFGGQVALLAPLEVLAQQHHKTLAKLFLPLGVSVQLLTGSLKPKEKDEIKRSLLSGNTSIIVGTHALLQDNVQFNNLAFAIIDEQHKFGVRQRAYLQRHGSPHLLQMTATPIPRSMALAFFGEFEVSTIDQLPAGRKPIHTKIVSEKEFIKLKPRVLTKIQQGQKVFLITPLIEESEALENIKAATVHHQELLTMYPEVKEKIGLLHGKMKPSDKETIMKQFKDGTFVMLVSTTVIEVGIDIPDATVMIIYNAERFGLSQLHQLRGRVGRSDLQSYCFLQTPTKSGESYTRLKHMESTTDGFALSEIDLQYRGPGEFLGVRQSGETDIPLEILSDTTMLTQVRLAANDILDNSPELIETLNKEGDNQSLLV